MLCGCGKKAIIKIRYLDKYFCKNCFHKSVEKRFIEYIKKNNLATKRDKIAVAVSGGKDSLTCLYLMNQFFKASAITINEGIKGYRDTTTNFVKKYCKEWDVDYHIFSFKKEIGYSLDEIVKKLKENPCAICGVLRRYILNKKAKELGFTKIATGHNLDDEAQSIFMSLFLSNIEALVRLGPVAGIIKSKGFVPRIKPLRLISEKEIMLYFISKNLEKSYIECPYSRTAFRLKIRDGLNVFENIFPSSKPNIVKNFDSLKKRFKKFKARIKVCGCGEPTSRKICKACEIIKKLKN